MLCHFAKSLGGRIDGQHQTKATGTPTLCRAAGPGRAHRNTSCHTHALGVDGQVTHLQGLRKTLNSSLCS